MAFAFYGDAARHDKGSSIVTMAGYVAPFGDWLPFETAADAICAKFGVEVIHGYHLETTRGEFAGWSRDQKTDFVTALQVALRPVGAFGIARSVVKAEFVAAKRLHNVMPNESPFGYCFRMIANDLCNDPVMRMNFDTIPGADISFIFECGDPNRGDVERIFKVLKQTSPFRGRLSAISFAGKDSTRSLQMADLLAFYARKQIAKYDDKTDSYPGVPAALEILATGVHIDAVVAHAFKLDKVSAFAKRPRKRPSA